MSAEPTLAASVPVNTRYHSLDALRAGAMLLGIFFHVAWCFVPYETGAPMMDVAANQPCNFFFYVTHVFRMQVFFLLAGFFARLVFLRVGYVKFALYRFSRIAVPFVVGWVIMYPLFTLYWVWGGIESGRILSTEPFGRLVVSSMLADELSWFSLTHLWFLYYLLLVYVLAISAELLFRHAVDRNRRIRASIDRLFSRQMHSRWSVIWLSIPLFLCHCWLADWFGIPTPSDSLRPHIPVLAAYTYFFFIGWLLHGQAHLLRRFEHRWCPKLLCGMALSIPLFLFFTQGVWNGTITWAYPLLFQNEIRDYSAMRAAVVATDQAGSTGVVPVIREALPPLWREFVERAPSPSMEQQSGLAWQITLALILDPTAFQPTSEQDQKSLELLKAEAARRGHAAIPIDATTPGTPLENRWLLEAALPPGTFAQNILLQPWYRAAVVVFSAVYAVATWLLIFGSIGFFLRYFANPNPLARYVADSSYWLYIIHLPIICQLNVLMARVEWHWLPKTLFFTVVAFAIMLPSYHYLVRSTWIGKVLNGRTYPFRPWFRRRCDQGATDNTPLPEPASSGDA